MRDDFDHLIAHSLAWTLEESDVYAMGYDRLVFGSLLEVIDLEQNGCIGKDEGGFDQARRSFTWIFDLALNEARHWGRLPRTRQRIATDSNCLDKELVRVGLLLVRAASADSKHASFILWALLGEQVVTCPRVSLMYWGYIKA